MEETEVTIIVKDRRFAVSKQALCEHSDYFKAMFSGNFKEHDQQEITLDIVDAESMELITKYLGNFQYLFFSLNKYTMSEMYNLAKAANLLLLAELASEIESFLVLQKVKTKTWFTFKRFAENMNYANLKQTLTEFGLPLLKDMKPQYVPSVQELVWYLSHTHLFVTNEYDVFKFGLDWMSHFNIDINSETFLMFLSCLDINRVTSIDLIQIRVLCLSVYGFGFDHCLASDVIQCLTEVSKYNTIITTEGIEQIATKERNISKTARNETLKLVEYSRSRQIEHSILVPVINVFTEDHKLHSFTPPHAEFEMCLDLDIKTHYLSCYGIRHYSAWDIAAWGPRNLVLVISPDSHILNRETIEVKSYNVLKKEWTSHNTKRAFSRGIVRKIAVIGDSLYIICDNEANIIYSLADATNYKTIAKLPSRVNSNVTDIPLFSCTHNNEVYVSDRRMVYKYVETADVWVKVIEHDSKILNMVSHNDGFIYVTDDNRNLSKFKPGTETMKTITKLKFNMTIHSYSLERRLLFFTDAPDGTLSIQEYSAGSDGETSQFKELWALKSSALKFDPKRNICSLVMTTPTIDSDVTEYLKRHLMRFNDQKK